MASPSDNHQTAHTKSYSLAIVTLTMPETSMTTVQQLVTCSSSMTNLFHGRPASKQASRHHHLKLNIKHYQAHQENLSGFALYSKKSDFLKSTLPRSFKITNLLLHSRITLSTMDARNTSMSFIISSENSSSKMSSNKNIV